MTDPTPTLIRLRRHGIGVLCAWLVFLVCALYLVMPLLAMFVFSMRAKPLFAAYSIAFGDPTFFKSLGYSITVGIVTTVVSLVLIVPTAYWVRLELARWRPLVEFITLLPLVIPPIILVFGLIRVYSARPFVLTATDSGSTVLLIAAYVVLSLPYMYRAVDNGLGTMDVRGLTEAAQSLGAGWSGVILRVVLPNLRTSIFAGAFLTLAVIVGEFTIASFMARPAFGPYLSLLGRSKAYEPAAISVISFAITWAAIGAISLIGRGGRSKVQIVGAR